MRVPTLVVDDQPDVRFLLRLLIDKANDGLVVVAEAGSGAEAIDRAVESDPLVVVMDEMMPGMTGVEAANRLRQERPSQVIILCTAYLDDELVQRARDAGVLHCISKDRVGDLPDLIRRAVAAR